MKKPVRILLVDDHPVVRDGVRSMLANEPGLEVAGEAASGEEAIKKCAELEPDVVLMDIRMPGMSGIEATQHIKNTHPATSVIMLTMYDSEMQAVQAVRCGAAGYLTKDTSKDLLCYAVRAVLQGGSLLPRELLRKPYLACQLTGVGFCNSFRT